MSDERIVQLYWDRNEEALRESDQRFGKYCRKIAKNILGSDADAEEIANDTLAEVWRSIPPQKPRHLLAFFATIARRLALSRVAHETREKRRHTAHLIYDELDEVLTDTRGDLTDEIALKDALHTFLTRLSKTDRVLFVKRYWYMTPIEQLALDMTMTKANVKTKLHRLRAALAEHLIHEGILEGATHERK